MKPSDKTMIHFYQQLGKLFYSIASADKEVQKEEVAQLNKLVKKQWVPQEDSINEFGDDAAYQIEIVFDWLLANEWHFRNVIPNLKNYKKEHPSIFTPQMNDLILKTAHAIEESFSGEQKLELDLINELTDLLHQEN
ncbi:hypothetical protein [Flavobacterium cellulosilyticum]|uniref:TerB family tellurite resistance protein n=1 Tax=Flavobacterium cellulosilyticum TaxID=2541731 RepID=A0A4R5CLQ1_9FLAO|nr:hypothetical protein [Flavobacterium cellulosilyticum]TDD99570.1 hypothetical protein E0F76_02255 [Flavobacterium cellulosilyticum]